MAKGKEKKIIKIAALSAAGIAGFLLIKSLLTGTRTNGGGSNYNGGGSNYNGGSSNNTNWAGSLIDLLKDLGKQIPDWIAAGKEAKNANDQALYQEYLQLQQELEEVNRRYTETGSEEDLARFWEIYDRMQVIENKISYMFD